ncbi:MAG: hypothetical protein AB1458_13090 [Bacteroidota bacterium]
MLTEEEFEFKKPEEDALPGEVPEADAPALARFSLASIFATALGAVNLFVFIPVIYFNGYFLYTFNAGTPAFLAILCMIGGIITGIIAMLKPPARAFFRYAGFWMNMLAVFLYLFMAFYYLFFPEGTEF